MRELKFREYLENGKFHYYGFVEEGLFKGPVNPSLTRATHEQFTGLLDKNGKEIYEGDIVDLRPEENDKIWHRTIEWDTAAFHCKSIHTTANHPLHFNKYGPDRIWIVIGNIHQNPELCKK